MLKRFPKVALYLILVTSLLGNVILFSSYSDELRKVSHLSSSIRTLHALNTKIYDQYGYRSDLSEKDIELCEALRSALTNIIERQAFIYSTGLGVISTAHARYAPWDINYTHTYSTYIDRCF